jgi:hypothetical protein
VTDPGKRVGNSWSTVVAGLVIGALYAGTVTGYARTLGYPVLESPVILYPLDRLTLAG